MKGENKGKGEGVQTGSVVISRGFAREGFVAREEENGGGGGKEVLPLSLAGSLPSLEARARSWGSRAAAPALFFSVSTPPRVRMCLFLPPPTLSYTPCLRPPVRTMRATSVMLCSLRCLGCQD